MQLPLTGETAEVFDLRAEEQVAELGEGEEDDEEHDAEASDIFGALEISLC